MNRYKAKYGADPTSVLRVIAEDPITPAEAIIKVKDAWFPVAALNERAQQLDSNPSSYNDAYIGDIINDNKGGYKFVPTSDTPIRKYPVDNTTKGALEIWALPEKDTEGKVFSNRYIIGVDPYDNDQADSSSLYSIFVLDLFTDKLVAEFTGRTDYAEDAHEWVRKLCLFYNAKAMYEANKKGLFAYMKAKNVTHLLAETPEYLRDRQLIKYSNFGSSNYGINASAPINNYANGLIKDWLNKLVPTAIKKEDGSESIQSIPNLFFIRSRALLEELIQFSPEINVDRVRALGMVMLYRQEWLIKSGGDLQNLSSNNDNDKDDPAEDDFFTRNYK